MSKTWGKVGRELVSKIEAAADEATIQSLGEATLKDVLKEEKTPEGQSTAIKMISREILKSYPRRELETPGYWYDPGGKADSAKWRHLIFKSMTLRPESQLQDVEPKVIQSTQSLKKMTIQQLDLDNETQETLETALRHTGLPLDEFIKQAIKVHARTVVGRNAFISADLSTVDTDELLESGKYKTNPARAEELVKRAIAAIKIYNSEVATEDGDRWMITQSAIATLIGSRAGTVGKLMQRYQVEIDDHNQQYELSPYGNRKSKPIREVINLSELVPNGLG